LCVWRADNPRAYDFTEFVVRDGDRGRFVDVWVCGERVLDLDWEQILATANDDVLYPADNCDEGGKESVMLCTKPSGGSQVRISEDTYF
jgi:hypothetical protein